MLEGVVAKVAAWPVDGLVVVLGSHADEILDSMDLGEATILINPEWEEGIASSLRAGLDSLGRDPRAERALITLGDQPWIPDEVPAGLIAGAAESGKPAIVPRYRYQRGNPVLVSRFLWPRLMSLEGDVGAARLLQAHPEWVHEVRFDHPPPRDVDTPADAADLLDDR
jgi:molybdenum cofactor cytidylyltransferase